jgi:VanZ family protein
MRESAQPWWWRPITRWAAWISFLAAWTFALLHPRPAELAGITLSVDATLVLAKSLHVSAYAFLAALTIALPVRKGARWALLILLGLHGAGTEAIQTLVPPRSGSVLDVGFNYLGLLVGLLLARRRRIGTARRSRYPISSKQ